MHERSISNKLCTISNKKRAFEIVQNWEKLNEIVRYALREIPDFTCVRTRALDLLLVGLQGSGRARWKELSKTNIFMCNRLLDDH